MIKLSRTGITTLKKQYKSVLLKCLLINAGILFAATGAMAADGDLSIATDGTVTGTNSGTSAITLDTSKMLTTDSALDGSKITAGTVAKTALDSSVQASLGLADSAVQSVATGSANGTISVDGTDVAVKGWSSKQDALTAGDGISLSGATISVKTTGTALDADGSGNLYVKVDNSTIESGSSGLNVKAGSIGSTQLDATTNAALTKANSAVQSITTGTTAGTIKVDGTEVAVKDVATLQTLTDSTTGVAKAQAAIADAAGNVITTTYVNKLTTINGHALSSNVTLTAADVGAVANTTKVNNKALSGDITLDATDVLTTAQQNAVNSGITSALVTQIGTNQTNITALQTATTFTADGNYYVQTDSVAAATKKVDAQVKTNTTDIATNATNIATNTTNIATNTGKISALETATTFTADGNYYVKTDSVADATKKVDAQVKTNTTDIATNASNIATNAGNITALQTATTFTADGNYYVQTDTVATAVKNIDTQVAANSSKIGAATLTTTATDLSGAVNELDAEMGNVSNLFSTGSGNIGRGDSVAAILSSVDTDLDAAVLKNTSQDTKLDSLATSIGGSYNASDAFVRNSYGTTLYTVSDSQSLTTAIGALDNALGSVATAKAAVAGASAATNMAAVVSQLSANLTNGTVNANFGNTTVDSLTIDGTSYGITSGGAATFASTTTDSLKVGSAAAITGETANTLNMHDNSLTNVKDIASAALTTNSSAKTVTIGGTGYTTTVTGDEVVTGKLGVTGDFAVNTNKFTVAAATGNTSIAGTLGVAGATTLDSTLSVAGKTTLSNANGLAFDDAATTVVKSIDNGSAAKTTTSANNATTMATVATVLKSAENAVYTGTATKDKTGTAPATISAALDLIGDVKALTTSDNFTNASAITVATLSDALQGIDATLGKIHGLASTSGTVTPSAGITSTVGSGTNLARGTTVEAHLVSLDNAIGNRETGFVTNKTVDYADTALNGQQDLVTVISQVASNVGVAADLTTAGTNGVAATNTVNANIDTVNKNLGDVQAAIAGSHYGTGAADLSEMVGKVDNKLYALDRDVRKLKKEFKGGMASMAAMTALVPNARAHGNTQLAIGTGAYEGHTAAAIGGFHWINDNLLLNIGVSYGDTSKAAYRAGVTWSW